MDQVVLTGAVYLLSGAILQVLGKVHLSWLVRHRKNVPTDSGSDVRIHELASHQHIDILSFLLIAVGSTDLILSELGTVEHSPTVLLISIPAIVATVGTGFSTYQMSPARGGSRPSADYESLPSSSSRFLERKFRQSSRWPLLEQSTQSC